MGGTKALGWGRKNANTISTATRKLLPRRYQSSYADKQSLSPALPSLFVTILTNIEGLCFKQTKCSPLSPDAVNWSTPGAYRERTWPACLANKNAPTALRKQGKPIVSSAYVLRLRTCGRSAGRGSGAPVRLTAPGAMEEYAREPWYGHGHRLRDSLCDAQANHGRRAGKATAPLPSP